MVIYAEKDKLDMHGLSHTHLVDSVAWYAPGFPGPSLYHTLVSESSSVDNLGS